MTTFRCRECGGHWTEGPTRDMKYGLLCRSCLIHKVKVCHSDATRASQAGTPEAAKDAIGTILATTSEAISSRSYSLVEPLEHLHQDVREALEQKRIEIEAQDFVRRVLTETFGQHPTDEQVQDVAKKVLKALPAPQAH